MATQATTFYRDTLDDTLLRVGPDGIPDVLWPDGTWHAYPDADLQTEAVEVQLDGARILAAGADLNGERSDEPAPEPTSSAAPAAAQ